MTERDYLISKKVFEKYPKTKKEITCNYEKNRLNGLREAYKKRLIAEYSDIPEYTSK